MPAQPTTSGRSRPLAEVAKNRSEQERGRKKKDNNQQAKRDTRTELKATYAIMRRDVKEYRGIKKLWEEGGHYRASLGLDKTARSREVVNAVKERCMLWHKDERNSFIKKCAAAELVFEPILPWPESVSDTVYQMWSTMKKEIRQKIEAQYRIEQQQQQHNLFDELYPFAQVTCSGNNAPVEAAHAISGVFTGLPVTAVPVVDLPRVVTWPEPHFWNECYNGNLDVVKSLLKNDGMVLNALGYVKTKPTAEISEPQRLGVKRLKNDSDGSTAHVLLPAPPGEETRATPLHYAIVGNQPSVVKWLVKKGASLDLSCQQGSHALQIAAKPPRPDLLKILHEQKCEKKDRGVLKKIADIFLH
eukprot:TRINITY_DN12014_c2_g1_i2.p1 TRINITY_DN12014_c2_g1~~TRINITY_DN12014_c2_g1_i2.p1  ORF type:complete len:373 (+),score=79.23 TRINITY_DN12014_c2_g1_i2:43-1119(+)